MCKKRCACLKKESLRKMIHFWDSPFMNMDLTFKEKDVEKIYNCSSLSYKRDCLFFFQFCILIFSFAHWLLNPFNIDNRRGLPLLINIIYIAPQIISIFLLKRKPHFKHPGLGIFLLQTLAILAYVEIIQLSKTSLKKANYIISSMLIEIALMMSVISRCSWKQNAITLSLLNFYLVFRMVTTEDIVNLNYMPIIFHILNTLLPTFGTYVHEKYHRKLYYAQTKNESDLRRFEQIIKHVLPSSIVISRREEVVFFNDETKRLFNIEEEKDLKSILMNISITTSPKYFEKNFSKSESDLMSNEELCDTPCQLSDVLKEESKRNNGVLGFDKFQGVFDAQSPTRGRTDKKYLEIKVGKINWRGENSLIIILTEDIAIERMNHLHEQARYKDKLLATVSHDLRTPLNGVIGVLEVAIDSVKDKALKKR